MSVDASTGVRIHWVVSGVTGSDLSTYASSLASNRYRVIAPARALNQGGHHVHLQSAETWAAPLSESANVIVLGKLLAGQRGGADFDRLSQRVLEGARLCANAGKPIVADFNDDHFAHPRLGNHWRKCAAMADLCVASTDAMASAVRSYTDAPIMIIGDPVASPRGEPRVSRPRSVLDRLLFARRRSPLKLVWYGNLGNWKPMLHWLEQMAAIAAQAPWTCWVVTRDDAAVRAQIDAFNQRFAPNASVHLMEWDEATQWDVVRDGDVVMIPSFVDSSFHRAKSTNRLVDAMHAGRYVIASPLPSYQPFASWVTLTEEPGAALKAYLMDPGAARAKIEAGQRYIDERYGVAVIGKLWGEALARVRSSDKSQRLTTHPTAETIRSTAADSPSAQGPTRLNLGCGDKVLPGFVNVDVVEARGGKRPDVLCDLHQLTVFEDCVADEVMAIHVVEHFWRWEIEDVLREWVRVLKPGGKMILECPNLQAACEEFLKDPDRFSSQGREGQRTMWVFYGDPAWKDPYMIHRWGYTPKSLAALMQSVGLVGVEQQAAQFKLREPRDMRLVGYKPA